MASAITRDVFSHIMRYCNLSTTNAILRSCRSLRTLTPYLRHDTQVHCERRILTSVQRLKNGVRDGETILANANSTMMLYHVRGVLKRWSLYTKCNAYSGGVGHHYRPCAFHGLANSKAYLQVRHGTTGISHVVYWTLTDAQSCIGLPRRGEITIADTTHAVAPHRVYDERDQLDIVGLTKWMRDAMSAHPHPPGDSTTSLDMARKRSNL